MLPSKIIPLESNFTQSESQSRDMFRYENPKRIRYFIHYADQIFSFHSIFPTRVEFRQWRNIEDKWDDKTLTDEK